MGVSRSLQRRGLTLFLLRLVYTIDEWGNEAWIFHALFFTKALNSQYFSHRSLTVFHHDCQKLDDDLWTGSKKDLTLATFFGIAQALEGISEHIHAHHGGCVWWTWIYKIIKIYWYIYISTCAIEESTLLTIFQSLIILPFSFFVGVARLFYTSTLCDTG